METEADKTPRVPIKKIDFTEHSHSVETIEDADEFLRQKAISVSTSGFYKVTYKIFWTDGKWYRGFYPLRYADQYGEKLFSLHLAGELMTKAGILKPYRMTPDEYFQHLKEKNDKYPGYSEHAKRFFLCYAR